MYAETFHKQGYLQVACPLKHVWTPGSNPRCTLSCKITLNPIQAGLLRAL